MSEFISALMEKIPGLLRIPEVMSQIGVKSHKTVYDRVKDRMLTRPVKIGERSVAWPAYEIAAINAARVSGVGEEELRTLVDRLHSKREELRSLIAGKSI